MKENEKKFECGLTLQEVKRVFQQFVWECGYNLNDYDLDHNFIFFNSIINEDLIIVVDLQTSRVFKYEGSIMKGYSFKLEEIQYLSIALVATNDFIELKKALRK